MSDDKRPDSCEQLERLVSVDRSALLAAARRLMGDAHQAEDVVQDTLAAVVAKVRRDPPRHLRRYVFAAVRRNALKARARRKLQAYLGDAAEAVVDAYCDEDDRLSPELLEEAIEGLPPAQQAVIRMKYFTGMTFRQIAAALSISINTAASRCRYGIAAMRKAIDTGRAESGSKGESNE